ncbi:hypothetical protein J8I87_29350 [Paraburkholderia sp. LEh10]|uniref:hypothetical protein n=1 Tax=Paraburkholderia sp. LEh10 TaxID=2821353 RepID=UPI001AE754E7|nr:hypothetical protein [Paraburkholderia sp. LEh10]MBP0593722.1 hypothetical protein [Paraburkholderia sp. LEh10]
MNTDGIRRHFETNAVIAPTDCTRNERDHRAAARQPVTIGSAAESPRILRRSYPAIGLRAEQHQRDERLEADQHNDRRRQ